MLNRYDWITVGAPIALAVLGVWLSLRPPDKKHHWLIALILIVLGGVGALSALIQIRQARESDESLRKTAKNKEDSLQATIADLKNQVTSLSQKSIPTLISDVKGLEPHKAVPADLTLRFIHPIEVAIVLDNAPHAGLADRPKYWAMLVDLDNPSDFLRIPTFMGDYIRPGEFMGPNQFMGLDAVKAVVKPGDRIFGGVGVSCPTCVKSRNYWLYVKAGDGGWYEEQQGPAKAIKDLDSAKKIAANFDSYADLLAPVGSRISIKESIDSPK